MKYILSRAYVEFGPFEVGEILDFSQRGLLRSGDFLRAEHSHHWDAMEFWLLTHTKTPPPSKPSPAAKAPAKKTAAKKKAPAKKAARKAPAKKAPPKGEA
ncbi:MAG: hypothetical protein KDM63_01165 [Verrucomicrobiae bacterium]|nr:hypothetical protein [Verrucomicrobiae bacterium]